MTADNKDRLQKVAEDLAEAAFGNMGQNCSTGSRILVDASIADEFAGHLAAAAEAHVVGDPQDPDTTMGSLIEESALERVSGYVDDAVSDIDDALRLARSVRAGTVSVNAYSEGDITTPFGGYKQSGFGGRDNGMEAFAQYTETKMIFINLH